MIADFQEAARFEFRAAANYYESCEPGLGIEFTAEVERTVARILDAPQLFPVYHSDARRALTRRFPYGVVYRVVGARVLILAIMHCHRRPGLWKNRT